MDSRSPTLELEEPSSAPKPPGSLFRTIKALSPGIYLCLPRELPPPFEPSTSASADLHAKHGSVHSAFATVPNARLQQQLPLLTYTRLSDVLYEAIRNNGVSFLLDRHLKTAMQVVVVKMHKEKEKVRNEVDTVERLHRASEDSSLYIGSSLLSSQHTVSASTSFAVLRPIFGPNLVQFGSLIDLPNHGGGIPSWLLAHICLGVLDALQYCHDVDVVLHGKIGAASVILSLYPTYMHHRYRGYPDVLLVGFSGAAATTEKEEGAVDEEEEKGKEEDVRAVLQVMEQVVTRWSDVASSLGGAGGGVEGDDAETGLLRQVQGILVDSYDGALGVDHVREQLSPRLEQMRHEGPDTIPQELMHLLHSDLVTGPELDRAVRDPVVIKFTAKKEEMRRIVEDVPIVMGGAGNAGMKIQGIMVMRFTSRKRKFLEAMGEVVVEEDRDVEMGGVEKSGAEMGGTEPAAFDVAVR